MSRLKRNLLRRCFQKQSRFSKNGELKIRKKVAQLETYSIKFVSKYYDGWIVFFSRSVDY